jgi:hypothetical protein
MPEKSHYYIIFKTNFFNYPLIREGKTANSEFCKKFLGPRIIETPGNNEDR